MPNPIMPVVLIAMTICTTGCWSTPEQKPDKPPPTASQKVDKIRADERQAEQDLKEYTFARREEFTAWMQTELGRVDRELDAISARIDQASEADKTAAKPRLQALREQSASLKQRLDQIKAATESTWEDVKAGFRKGYSDLQTGFREVRQWASEKIAPK